MTKWIETGVISVDNPSRSEGAAPFAPWRIDPEKPFLPQARREIKTASAEVRSKLAETLPRLIARKLGPWSAGEISIGLDLCRAVGAEGFYNLAKRILQSDVILTKDEQEQKNIAHAVLRATIDLCSDEEARAVVVCLLSSRLRSPDLAPAAFSALNIIDPDNWPSTIAMLEDDLETYFHDRGEAAFVQLLTEFLDRVSAAQLAFGLLDDALGDGVKRWLFATHVHLHPEGRPRPFLEILLEEDRPGAEQLFRHLEIDPDDGTRMHAPQLLAPSRLAFGLAGLEDRWLTRARQLHDSVNTLSIGKNHMPWQADIIQLRHANAQAQSFIEKTREKLSEFLRA